MESEPGTASVFDLKVAQARIPGGLEVVKEVAQLLLEECPKMFDEIRQGLTSANAKQVERGAHTIKGSADVFAATRVVVAARRLEELARDGDLKSAEDAAAKLEIELKQLIEAVSEVTKPTAP